MEYEKYPPHPALKRMVRFYWRFSVAAGRPGPGLRVLNEGMELILNLADPIELGEGPRGTAVPSAAAAVSGPTTRPMRFSSGGEVDIFGVCFQPGAGSLFLREPASNWTDAAQEVANARGGKWARFPGRAISGCCSTAERAAAMDRRFLQLREERRKEDPDIDAALDIIEGNRGGIRIGRLAGLLGMSCRQLERKFKERVGMSPKQYCRNLRFKQVHVRPPGASDASWAMTALSCGYYDQSHMIRDFRHYTGKSPAAYFAGDAMAEKVLFSTG